MQEAQKLFYIKPIKRKPSLVLIVTAMLLISVAVFPTNVAYSTQDDNPKHVPGRLLIKFSDGISVDVQNWILRKQGVEVEDSMPQINIQVLKVPENSLIGIKSKLEKISGVEYVQTDSIIEPQIMPDDTEFSKQWHHNKIQTPNAWETSEGRQDIIIAILDSGFDATHPDLAGKFLASEGYNVVDRNNDWSVVSCGHGNLVAGAAGAMTNNNLGVAGVGWNNKILPIRITTSNCYSTSYYIAAGITYAADHGAKVANVSFGIYAGDRTITNAAKYMYNHGGLVVAAGGNNGQTLSYKDNRYIISVGATDEHDDIASFSTRGKYIDFTAPGVSIYTTCRCTTSVFNSTGAFYYPVDYMYATGTSLSAPIVSGLIALMFSQNSSITPSQVYDNLKQSAIDLGSAGYDTSFGWGRIDAGKALKSIVTNVPQPATINVQPNIDTASQSISPSSAGEEAVSSTEQVETSTSVEDESKENPGQSKKSGDNKQNKESKSSGNSGQSKKSKK